MERIIKNFNKYILLYLVLLTLPAVFALLVPGFYGASDDLHVAWLYEMHRTLMMWQIPPRFVPDLSYGFGYPLFNFVFPLPFYIGEVFHLLGFNFVDSVKAVFFISFPISAIFMYLFIRQFSSKIVSFTGALLYVYTPYRFTDLYIRGAIGEILGFAILPIVGLSFLKLTEKEKSSSLWIGLGGVSLASLILTHNITAYMFFPAIFFLAILRVIFYSKEKLRQLIGLFISIILGILISSYFWLPAIVESSLMKYDTVFNYADHFPTIKQLITPFWGYGASVPGPYDLMSFFLGYVNWIILVSGLIIAAILFKKIKVDQKIVLLWATFIFGITFFMMNYRSSILWDNLPLLPYFQFPWRFFILTTFVVPIFLIPLDLVRFKNQICIVLVVFILATNIQYLRPNDFLGRTDSYYLNRYVPYPKASEEYKLTQEEYLRLPKNTLVRPTELNPIVSSESVQITNISRLNALDTTFVIESTSGGVVNYNKYNFPGWKATVDDNPVKLHSGEPHGQIQFNVLPGNHQIKVMFGETVFRWLFDLISLISLIIALILIFLNLRYNKKAV